MKKNLAIFASGNGSNAINIIKHSKSSEDVDVKILICNVEDANVVKSAKKLGIQVLTITNQEVEDDKFLIENCNWYNVNLIVLAGFLRKLPEKFVDYFEGQIINIHPSLLPKYGGQGMYGDYVHKKVLDNKDSISGITIHYVNNDYDSGEIIAQFECELDTNETLETLKSKINTLEMIYYPYVIETILV